jgi:hypothetical protein
MDNEAEFYENSNPKTYIQRVHPMRLPVPQRMTHPQLHRSLLSAKTLRSKLAVCFHRMSQDGMFSDAPEELWVLREEVKAHLPEDIYL